MAQPAFLTSAIVGAVSSAFQQRLAVQIDLGTSGDVAVLVQAYVNAVAGTTVTGITIGGTMTGGANTTNAEGLTKNQGGTISGGTALTLDATVASFLGVVGNSRAGALAPVSLTGLQWVQMVCNDGNGKPTLAVSVYSGASGVSAGTAFTSSGYSPSQSVTTTADDVAAMLFYISSGDASTVAASSPTVQRQRGLVAAGQGFGSVVWDEPGVAGTTTLQGTITGGATPTVDGTKWVVQGITGGGGSIVGPGHLDSPLLTGRLLRGLAR